MLQQPEPYQELIIIVQATKGKRSDQFTTLDAIFKCPGKPFNHHQI
jgi:hypothetical protein